MRPSFAAAFSVTKWSVLSVSDFVSYPSAMLLPNCPSSSSQGMGKTLVVISLVKMNPATDHCTTKSDWDRLVERANYPAQPARHHYVATHELDPQFDPKKRGGIYPNYTNTPGDVSLYPRTSKYKYERRLNPAYDTWVPKPSFRAGAKLTTNGKLKLKATVIFTSVSLFGQVSVISSHLYRYVLASAFGL